MADLLAIVSKAVFEAGAKGAAVGQVLPLDRYTSSNKALEPLRGGGRLFLVTVRPPDEKLWLVAVLEAPKHDGTAWVASTNRVPITDVTALRGRIKFASGAGISATKGALGMSLQTPRELTGDVALLLGATTGAAEPVPAKAAPPMPAPPATPATKGAATDVAALLRANRHAAALAALLRRWQDECAPELAELIERLSPSADPETTALLASLTGGRFADALARVQALASRPPDPRIAAALTRFIVTPPFTAQSSREFWSSLYEQLADRHADRARWPPSALSSTATSRFSVRQKWARRCSAAPARSSRRWRSAFRPCPPARASSTPTRCSRPAIRAATSSR
jgi:hypothetical protein